jgi:type IV pilus assembly protein PilN
MIKVNLLPVKRKKKAKPLPSFLLATIAVTVAACLIMGYLVFFFTTRLSERKATFARNEKTNAELKEKIKAVEDFEKRNKNFKERNDIIEQLSKNRSIPARLLDELSSLQPAGIWLRSLTVTGEAISLDGYGFTNTEIVTYVDNIKGSKLFTDVYLQESKSTELEKIALYMFKLTLKIKG